MMISASTIRIMASHLFAGLLTVAVSSSLAFESALAAPSTKPTKTQKANQKGSAIKDSASQKPGTQKPSQQRARQR